MGVMSDFDPDKVETRRVARATAGMQRITGIDPSTGRVSVEGDSSSNLYLYMDMGGHLKVAPMQDNGIDQDLNAHASRRPRSLADVGGIDQLG